MSVDYMFLEYLVFEDNIGGEDSFGDEDVFKRKVLCRRFLIWRSENLNSFFV